MILIQKLLDSDLVASYSTVLFGADADISAAWNHTETEVTNSGAVTGASKVRRLEEGLPEDRMTITVAQTWSDKVSSFVRANMYGEYYAVHADWFGTTSDAEWTVDASVKRSAYRQFKCFSWCSKPI